jgi:hypothetical protein
LFTIASQLGSAQFPPLEPNVPNPQSVSRSPFSWHGACSAGGYSNSSSKEERKTKKKVQGEVKITSLFAASQSPNACKKGQRLAEYETPS